jgi:predicted amidophosphoribosyltransferase
MNEPNFNVDPDFDSEDEWLICYECGADFLRYDKHCSMCKACVEQELKENEEREDELSERTN